MTKQTPCCWFGLPALPLNETTITEWWGAGECRLHVFGPAGVLFVAFVESDGCRRRYEVEVDLSPDCKLVNARGVEFFDDNVPSRVLMALELELQRIGYCPDGPVEFARKASPAQRELVLEWAHENAPWYDEAAAVLAMFGGQRVAA